MSDEQTLVRAKRAEAILGDPLVSEVLQAMADAIAEQFFATPADSFEQLRPLHMMDAARRQFEAAFRALITGGRVVAADRHIEAAMLEAQDKIRQHVKER